MEDNKQIFDSLTEKLKENEKQYDIAKITSAYQLAEKCHEGQKRDSGEPYITHPVAVAKILIELGMDTDTICAALLHDVVEDTDMCLEEIGKRFGKDVMNLVDGVTKLGKIPLFTKEEQQAENVRKILLAMSQDIRVIIIKLCDRVHNMRTLKYRSEEKRRQTALETMNIYVPIANRLGMSAIKEEIEDISFHYLDPFACNEIEQMLEKDAKEREEFIDSIKERIKARLSEDFKVVPTVEGRVKSLYGIYKKVYMKGKNFDEIYDKYAVRVIVNTVTECYNVLGIIHDMFKPIPNRFKDYISTPKPNMYQSLHTTVVGREGIPFEVQIRTWEMHYTAEYGIAAHWKYKEGIQGKDKFESRLAWIRQIIEAQQDSDDVEEIVRTIKSDIAPEEVYAFTPKGDMISLPAGSTVIDFAYAIHTQVGHKMTGAKVDKKIVPIDYVLSTGEIVDIITTEGHGPNRNWLNICKTNEARTKIRSWFKKERREENIEQGKAELDKEFKRNGIKVPPEDLEEFLSDDMRRHSCQTLDDFYAAIGYGGIILSKFIQRLKDQYTKKYVVSGQIDSSDIHAKIAETNNKTRSGIVIDDIDNMLIKFSKCCSPLPGDDIVGFITRGHGISIHKVDCINYLSQKDNPETKDRWVKVEWSKNCTESYKATLDVVSNDRNGLLADVSSVLAGMRIPIHELSARELKNGNANILITLGIAGLDQLSNVIRNLTKIKGVISVDRCGKV